MKILQIKFENINSLKGKHEINFDQSPLCDAGLFAITGPTGSGKTTILDVISLALYNEIPRMGKISKSTIESSGSVITRNTDHAAASITYECKEGKFTSEWTISYNRNNNLRDYEMNIFNANGQSLGLKKSEIPAKNAALVGLEYEQFVRSILLAQGDFAQFLKSGEKERAKLLEKITGTFIYRKLGQLAYDKAKTLRKKTEEIDQQIKGTEEQLLSDEAFEEKEKGYELAKSELEKQKTKEKKLQKSIDLKEELEQLNSKKNKAELELTNNKNALEEFKNNEGLALEKHQKLAPFAEKLNKWKDSIEQKQKAKQRIDLIETEQQKSKDGQAQLLDKIDKLTGKKCNAENAIKTLKNLYEEYSELARDREELANQFSQIKKSLSKYELKEQLKSNVNEPAEFIKELISFKEKKQGEIEIANKNLSAHPFYQQEKLLVEIGGILSQIRNAELKIDHLKSAIDSNKNKQKRFQDELKTIPDSLKETKLISEKLEAEVQQLRTEKELKHLRASLEEHRQNLVNGEPCPLCGSEHHPWAENVEAPEFDNQKLRDKESAWENSKEKLAKLKTQKDNLEQLLSDLENEQNQLKKDFTAFEKQNISAREKLPPSLQKESPEKIEQQRDSFKQMQQNAEQIQKFITEADKMLPEAEDLQEILEKGKSKKEELEKLYSGSEPLHNLMESITHDWEEVRTSLAKLEHEKEQRENEKKQFNNLQIQLEKSLKPELQKLNYEQIEDAIKELLPYATEKHLNEKSQRLRDALAKTKNDLNHFKEQFKNKKAQDIEDTKEALKASLDSVSSEIEQLDEKSKNLYADLNRQKKNLEFIDRKKTEKAKIIGDGEKWLLLEQQIGDATGNKFSTFAQQLTLEQLILLANKRLEGLSKRYLLAMPVDQGDLVAVDRDMGDQERSVKTLSGGETFLISLALALALSDLASQNIQIESMFIDEGFGTLDPETLDLTLDVLEKLQANDNRMIGIISHVEALKERINTQIQLIPSGQGYSKLALVGA